MATVIEVLEMTIYTKYGGFDGLNHRGFYFCESYMFFACALNRL